MAKEVNYSKKEAKDFNILTRLYQLYAIFIVFPLATFLFYKFKFSGKENIKKGVDYIVAPNHISYLDVFIVARAVLRPLSYMAKEELFNSNYVAKNIRRLGAFAVNREKPKISTIKSVREVFKNKGWSLVIFPQGGIRKNKAIENVNKGVTFFAKNHKVDILPVAISGLETYNWNPFKRQLVEIKVGEPISYEKPDDEIIHEWCLQIAQKTGYDYKKEEVLK